MNERYDEWGGLAAETYAANSAVPGWEINTGVCKLPCQDKDVPVDQNFIRISRGQEWKLRFGKPLPSPFLR